MAEVLDRPSEAQVWAWLGEVPDPEIPVVSVVDLGIVRDVSWEGHTLLVTLTPTYSGCPATSVITLEVDKALREKGLENFRIETRIAPAWTTDWISEEGRAKLLDYGIAPPAGEASCAGALALSGTAAAEIKCPRCGSQATERVSQFGSTPCKASYRCKDCLEPFDYFKVI